MENVKNWRWAISTFVKCLRYSCFSWIAAWKCTLYFVFTCKCRTSPESTNVIFLIKWNDWIVIWPWRTPKCVPKNFEKKDKIMLKSTLKTLKIKRKCARYPAHIHILKATTTRVFLVCVSIDKFAPYCHTLQFLLCTELFKFWNFLIDGNFQIQILHLLYFFPFDRHFNYTSFTFFSLYASV